MTSTRGHQAPLKIIGLGLGRTGTVSLCTALEILGFGPCHHPALLGVESDYWSRVAKAAKGELSVLRFIIWNSHRLKGDTSPEVLDDIFRGYVTAMDSTTAVLAEPLYQAYPEAKFILTTRDPAKWAQSMHKTINRFYIDYKERQSRIASGTASKADVILYTEMEELGMVDWVDVYHERYHHGRLETDPEGELERHNKFIIQLIPPEKLLVFDVADGWKPLVEFLGVPEPSQPFPHLNDPVEFEKKGKAWWDKLMAGLSENGSH
ncbi:hypothetical protein Clacol_003414 [Clathrus columnatus]|uniref:P-loop containing nucleoside triphosphate hydrolase protein n=1 Tax=Clathrus columnatus TaxID=1419009 RepID=A0AAV5A6R0_9AGAM|nr:hypothetical protein Clacol_003414 [Clathrus columnatus]